MQTVKPEVFLISAPSIRWEEMKRYLETIGGEEWFIRILKQAMDSDVDFHDGEALVEFMGRLCYKSWKPGLNPNVTKVRQDSAEYIANLLRQIHGSVFEHANYSFVFHCVSRVETHEQVRHRVGVAISQESMRYVRLDDLPIWQPDWALADEELQSEVRAWLQHTESLQRWMANHFGLDDERVPFSEKKHKTSYMRRWSPQGVATELGWSANIRTLRHTIEQRTSEGAEEEIRLVFDQVAQIMKQECPMFFDDFIRTEEGAWLPSYRKV